MGCRTQVHETPGQRTHVFEHVEGRLDFKDVLDGPGAPFFPYRGHLTV